jgi:hypothetical protein
MSAMGQHERPRALQGPAHLLGGYVELLLDGVAQLVDALRQRDQPRSFSFALGSHLPMAIAS